MVRRSDEAACERRHPGCGGRRQIHDFYVEGLGWRPTLHVPGDVLFLQVGGGVLLALWSVDAMVREAGPTAPAADERGRAPITLGHNVNSETDVESVRETASRAGGRVLVPAARRAWGGCSGYFTDPDGYRWGWCTTPVSSCDRTAPLPSSIPVRPDRGSCPDAGIRAVRRSCRYRVALGDVNDPLQPLVDLPGVRDAADRARDALGEVHRHRTNRRGWPTTAAEAAVRAARASASIDGGSTELPGVGEAGDPVLTGALRVAQALDGDALPITVSTWQRAPLQALARLHLLAATGIREDAADLGRPRVGAGVSERLDLLAQLVTGGTTAPAPVLASVVHGELLALEPFGTADGVVARAASRLVAVSTGLDPHNLGVPEVSWLRRQQAYRSAAAGFASGTADGVGGWVIFCCGALESGAREALSIAEAAAG